MTGRIFQINVSQGGVPKLATSQAFVTVNGLEGDAVNHPGIHGGPERAVCLYSLERILALQEEGHPIFSGAVGENLTLIGLDWNAVQPGVTLAVGDQENGALLQVTRYTTPCGTIARYFRDGDPRRISQEHHPGWSRVYTQVLKEGTVHVGDSVTLQGRLADDKQIPRPSFEQVYMDFAEAISRRSTCLRLQVGTVITTTDYRKVLAIGYNGNATGLPNRCDRAEPGNCGCLHSEENAVINCDSPRYVDKYLFVTHLPCVACAKRIINLGNVRRVVFKHDYRLRDALQLLRTAGIPAFQLQQGRLVPMDE